MARAPADEDLLSLGHGHVEDPSIDQLAEAAGRTDERLASDG